MDGLSKEVVQPAWPATIDSASETTRIQRIIEVLAIQLGKLAGEQLARDSLQSIAQRQDVR